MLYVCSSGKGLDWIDCKLLPKTSEYSCNKNNSLFFLCTYMYIYRYLVYVSLEKRLKRIFSHHQSLIKIARDCLTTLYHFYFFLHNNFKLVWIIVDLCHTWRGQVQFRSILNEHHELRQNNVRTPRTQPGNGGKFSVFWYFCYENNQIKTTTET